MVFHMNYRGRWFSLCVLHWAVVSAVWGLCSAAKSIWPSSEGVHSHSQVRALFMCSRRHGNLVSKIWFCLGILHLIIFIHLKSKLLFCKYFVLLYLFVCICILVPGISTIAELKYEIRCLFLIETSWVCVIVLFWLYPENNFLKLHKSYACGGSLETSIADFRALADSLAVSCCFWPPPFLSSHPPTSGRRRKYVREGRRGRTASQLQAVLFTPPSSLL